MYYPDVPALEPEELELLCHEYVEHNATLDPHLADQRKRCFPCLTIEFLWLFGYVCRNK